ncbi:MAG TPA: glycosyltransferase family 4 protein [Methylomirabilota bacterium]|nr:glycosyltransferase family 4 protein [Methylomirabilota bacterium]
MRPLRILHVVANRWWTGSADPALDLARTLRERGHSVWFACVRGDVLEAHVRTAGVELVDALSLERTSRPWRLVAQIRGLKGLIRELGVDVVHAHQTHDHWLAALGRTGTEARLVRTVHHRRAVHAGPAARWLWGRTDAVIAVSEGIAGRLRAAGGPARVTVVPGAVDVDRFSPGADGESVRIELGLGDAPVVGCLARMAPGRGHDVLLQAVARLRERLPGVRLVLVGRGERRPALEALVRDLRLDSTVVFAGYRGADLPAVLGALDCLVLLGEGSEESCRAVLEAMAVGRPVIAAPVGAVPEIVVDGETGWMVDPAPDAVADRLDTALRDRGRLRRMGEAGRRRMLALFTPSRRAALVEEVYGQVLAKEALPRR